MNTRVGYASSVKAVVGILLLLLGLNALGRSMILGLVFLLIGAGLLGSIYEVGKLKRVKRAFDSAYDSRGTISLQALSEELDMEVEDVKESLQELTRRGLAPKMNFLSSHDEGTLDSVVSQQPGSRYSSASREVPPSASSTPSDWVYVAQDPQPSVTIVRCKGCGAVTNLAIGQIKECEHCGSQLQL